MTFHTDRRDPLAGMGRETKMEEPPRDDLAAATDVITTDHHKPWAKAFTDYAEQEHLVRRVGVEGYAELAAVFLAGWEAKGREN